MIRWLKTRLYCGIGTFEIRLGQEDIKVKVRQCGSDWNWDHQSRPRVAGRHLEEQ
jgi:hypothetical protein